MKLARQRLLTIGKNNIKWLLRDEFTNILAAGAVNGTKATDGHSVRTVVDTNNYLSIAPINIYDIFCYGDSKTLGSSVPWRMGSTTRQCLEVPLRDGVSGATVAIRVLTITTDLAVYIGTPEFILWNLGSNDSVSLPVEATWKANALTILDGLHAKWSDAKIYIARTWRRNYNANSTTINGWQNYLIAQRPTFCFAGLDEWALLENGDNGVTYTQEGVHPNTAGYLRCANSYVTLLGI